MPLEVLYPCVIAGWALTLTTLERLFPFIKGYKVFRPDFWNDLLMYTFFQNYILAIVISWIIVLVDSLTGLSHFGFVSQWPLWLQMMFFLVKHDFWQYWFHRFQ